MTTPSSFAPAEIPRKRGPAWAGSLHGALNACAFSIPLTLGCVTIVFGHHAPALLPAAVVATLVGIALMQLASIAAKRPIVFAVRVLESATLWRWSTPPCGGFPNGASPTRRRCGSR